MSHPGSGPNPPRSERTGSKGSWVTLRQLLLDSYEDFKNRLTRRLGSADLAGDALQDTFLRLESTHDIGPVSSPESYLFRIALNIAADHRRAERRRLNSVEIDELLDLADETPDPAKVTEARSEIEELRRALAELPARRREIFLAAWVDGIPRPEIAKRYGVTVRTIKVELKRAREHCAARLQRYLTDV